MKKYCLKIVFMFISTVSISFARIIYVPSEYQEIQAAINASVDGDTVLLSPGIYNQTLSLGGKKIILASLYLTTNDKSYIDSTRLEYDQNGYCIISCGMNEDSTTKIIGFTIGSDVLGCNGILCAYNSSPLISENIFKTWLDYGIRCEGTSNPIIRRNNFLRKYSHISYYSIDVFSGSARIENNYFYGSMETTISNETAIRIGNAKNVFISGNTIKHFKFGIHDGGYETNKTNIINNLIYNCSTGIFCGYKADPLLINNSIVYNIEYGIQATYGIPEIINCIFWGNKKDFNGTISISHSCMWGCLPYKVIDKGANIFRDPQFVNITNENFRLKGNSPCIDAGFSDSLTYGISEYDIDFNRRSQDGDGNKTSVIDIGCYEKAEAVNPAYVSGTITLSGGSGKVEDVKVGIGATVHPDINGRYIFAISAPDSFYNVSASLNNYLEQEIKDVDIKAGVTTQDVNFDLEYYNPTKILEIEPDTLRLLTTYISKLNLKNISLIDIYILWIQNSSTIYYENFSIPHLISPGDSCELSIYLEHITKKNIYTSVLDSLIIFFNADSTMVPILYDPSLVDVRKDESQELNTFHLSQNFPNPFNPTTKISYTLSAISDVSLKVYDLLGREVATLVNEKKSAGTYTVTWNATNMPSNIYFYRIQTGSFIETKKLVLIK